MNHLERFRAVMDFQPVDRLPRIEWASWWDRTIARWQGEGLPPGDRYALYETFGLDPYYQAWIGTRRGDCPRAASHGAPLLETMDQYLDFRRHLYPDPPCALAEMAPWLERQRQGQALVWFTLEGFFWHARSLLGIEGHLLAFYDQVELLHRIADDLADYHLRTLEALRPAGAPAFVTFAEDMSYNHGPMLSRKLFEEFIAPGYRRVVPRLREMGIRVWVDTDGDVTALVPWLLDAGVEGVLPLERQAGVDGLALRRAFPRLGMIGHFDKMAMPGGEAALRAEFERLAPLMRSGGFLPSVDHQTPPGVSLADYRLYLRLLEEYTRSAAPTGTGGPAR